MSFEFSQTGGARLNNSNATYPFAQIAVTADAIRLTSLGSEYLFPKSQIQSLDKYSGLFSTGLQIHHCVSTAPQFVVFWLSPFGGSAAFVDLKARLQALGYQIGA